MWPPCTRKWNPEPAELPSDGLGHWQPFTKDQTAALRETYADDLFWLTAGADGLATPDRELNRHKNQHKAGQKGDRIKGHHHGQRTKKNWRNLAEAELRGRSLDDLTWNTLEGIDVKPLYTAEDNRRAGSPRRHPGEAPFTRGVKATMYAGRPWTIRQYAGFSTAEESNAFYRRALSQGSKVSRCIRSGHPPRLLTVITPA